MINTANVRFVIIQNNTLLKHKLMINTANVRFVIIQNNTLLKL